MILRAFGYTILIEKRMDTVYDEHTQRVYIYHLGWLKRQKYRNRLMKIEPPRYVRLKNSDTMVRNKIAAIKRLREIVRGDLGVTLGLKYCKELVDKWGY